LTFVIHQKNRDKKNNGKMARQEMLSALIYKSNIESIENLNKLPVTWGNFLLISKEPMFLFHSLSE
jgi:hypothetical protein